jgi:hypothetical protein
LLFKLPYIYVSVICLYLHISEPVRNFLRQTVQMIQNTACELHLVLSISYLKVDYSPISSPSILLGHGSTFIICCLIDKCNHHLAVKHYFLTYSMKHNPSCEANLSLASEGNPRILCNPKVNCRFHKCPSTVSILSQIYSVHARHIPLTEYPLKYYTLIVTDS